MVKTYKRVKIRLDLQSENMVYSGSITYNKNKLSSVPEYNQKTMDQTKYNRINIKKPPGSPINCREVFGMG